MSKKTTKPTKPDTPRLLREYERAKAASVRASITQDRARVRYSKAEAALRAALGLTTTQTIIGGVSFTTSSGMTLRMGAT